jgi:type IV secretion system protein VirB10
MVGAAAMLLVAGFLVAATWGEGDAAEAEPGERKPAGPVVTFPGPPRLAGGAADPNAPVLNPGAVDDAQLATAPPPPRQPIEHTVPAISTSSGYAAPQVSAPSPADARSDDRRAVFESAQRAPIIAWSARQRGAEQTGSVRLAALSSGQRSPGGEPTRLDELRGGASVGESRARLLPDRKFLITAGSSIPCVLQTALDSSVPGYAACIVPRDVLSDDGRVVLLDRGTRILGEYRGGVRQGERRLFVLWTRAVTPAGVAVDLASPAADALGRSGFDGQLDSRFWDRFGGALLLSIVDDAAYVAGQSVADSQFNNTSRFPVRGSGHRAPKQHRGATRCSGSAGRGRLHSGRSGINFADVYGLSSVSDTAVLMHHLAPLQPHLAAPDVTELVINRPGEIGVEGPGGWRWHELRELTAPWLSTLATRRGGLHAPGMSRRANPSAPPVLPGGERCQIVLPPGGAGPSNPP